MSSVENVEIFEDTKRLCETNGKIKEALAQSVKNQKLILEGEELSPVDKTRFSDEAKIVVSTERTFEAAAGYAGQKVAVHNFASATNPGRRRDKRIQRTGGMSVSVFRPVFLPERTGNDERILLPSSECKESDQQCGYHLYAGCDRIQDGYEQAEADG